MKEKCKGGDISAANSPFLTDGKHPRHSGFV